MKQTILVPKKEIDHIKELTSGILNKEIKQKYGYKEGVIISNSVFFPDNMEVRIQIIIANNDSTPVIEIALYLDDDLLINKILQNSDYEGDWSIEYEGETYEIEVKSGLEESIWQKLLKEKYNAGEFHTDSDVEDFANECGVSYGDVFHYIDVLTSVGTPCEKCKHIAFRYNFFPCVNCSRNPEVKDRFET